MIEYSWQAARLSRPRALTSTPLSTTFMNVNTTGEKSKHGRAISEMNISNTQNLNPESSESKSPGIGTMASYLEHASSRFRLSTGSQTKPLLDPSLPTIGHSFDSDDGVISRPSSPGNSWPFQPSILSKFPIDASNPAIPRTTPKSIQESYDEHEEHASDSDLMKAARKNLKHIDEKESGASFDELVDRLLSPAMSKADSKFTAVFLCLYRKFAAPSELVSAIVYRFNILNSTHYPQLLRSSSQLRYLSVLTYWISDYPGDFAHPLTRQSITDFIAGLAETRIFAIACKEMNAHLDIVADDDDTEWACSDTSRSRASTAESFLSTISTRSTTSTLNPDSATEEVSSDLVLGESLQRQSTQNSATTSIASSACRSGSQSTASFQSLLNSVENAQRLAQHLTPIPKDPLTKLQWHQFMETPEEDIAKELTRIDWIMFCSIRPRDLIRHVSLPVDMRERCKSLENVNRMIDHFNHVAFWVANTILLRDKPKHRAKALERFMGVAWVRGYVQLALSSALTYATEASTSQQL